MSGKKPSGDWVEIPGRDLGPGLRRWAGRLSNAEVGQVRALVVVSSLDGPEFHINVSVQETNGRGPDAPCTSRRPDDRELTVAMLAFDMLDAREDNSAGKRTDVRHLWLRRGAS